MSDKKTYPKLLRPIEEPSRNPDYHSKRGVPYWWAPEWVRGISSSASSFQRIVPLKVNDDVELHMVSKEGSLTYIRGSIQREFKKWHEDAQIDYILLGMDEDDLLQAEWMEE